MQWIRAHRYTVAFIAIAVLVVVGVMLAKNNTGDGLAPADIENLPVEYPYYTPSSGESVNTGTSQGGVQNPAQDAGSPSVAWLFTPPASQTTEPSATAVPAVATKVSETKPAPVPSVPQNDPYTYFFSKLSSILGRTQTQTTEQKALFAYGNEAGSLVAGFESSHKNVAQTLKIFFDTRTDPARTPIKEDIAGAYARLQESFAPSGSITRAQATELVTTLGDEYVQLSTAIAGLQNVPPQAEALNAKLAKGYADVAQGLSLLTKAEDDAQLLEAIKAYNGTADGFIKNYVALIQFFSANGVTFSANDPGAIFSFNTAGSL